MDESAEIKIEQRQIWEVLTHNFLTSGKNNNFKRPVNLKRGEMIEIRYAYAWHFRTEDDIYFHAIPQTILDNCRLHGVIWENVGFSNRAKLQEIMEIQLFKPEDNFNRINAICSYCKEEFQQREKHYRKTNDIFKNCGCKDEGE